MLAVIYYLLKSIKLFIKISLIATLICLLIGISNAYSWKGTIKITKNVNGVLTLSDGGSDILAQDLFDNKIEYAHRDNPTYKVGYLTGINSSYPIYFSSHPDAGDAPNTEIIGVTLFDKDDIAKMRQLKALRELPKPVTTYDPLYCAKYTNHIVDIGIGITASNPTPQDLYAVGNDPAVLIIKPNLSPLPTIDKITFKGNAYGKVKGTSNFNRTAVVINNTNNINIRDGIEINSGCRIEGKIAIDIKDDLTTNIINRGTIHGDDYSFHDHTNSAQSYEIHNHANATIEGEIYTAAKRIENSGSINGKISINYSSITIENMSGGNIVSSEIDWHNGGHIMLDNHGNITVSGKLDIDRDFTNYGNITAGDIKTSGKLTNNSTGNMQLNSGLSFRDEVENHGIINVTGNDTFHFYKKVTNTGNITSPYGFQFDDDLDNRATGKIALGYTSGTHSIDGDVNNHGSLYFTSHVDEVTIADYHGYNNSELVLTLPSSAPSGALLTVSNNANFDTGAKIILAATQSLAYLATSRRITILQANNLTGTGINKPEDLLFTRVYDANYKTTTTINANSILFSIENVTAINNTISAKLTLNSISALGLQATTLQTELIDSLLSNKIIAASLIHKKIIKTANPVDCVKYTSNDSIIDIGITASNSIPQDLYAKGSDPAVLIIKSGLSPLPTIDKITFKGNAYGTVKGSSNFDKTAVVINNTNNMTIKDGIHISNNSTIRGRYGIYIKDAITTNIINDGTISGSSLGIIFEYNNILNGTLTNQGVISARKAIFIHHHTVRGKNLVIENSKIGLIKGIVSCYGHNSGVILVNHGMIDTTRSDISITTNAGSITNSTNKKLIITGSLTNTGTIIADKHSSTDKKSLIFYENVYNTGYIKSLYTTLLKDGKTLTNEGTFTTAALILTRIYYVSSTPKQNIFLHNQTKNAVAEFTASFNEPYLHINNQGSLSLQGSSTIGNYTGNATSELVLTLPNSQLTTPLLTVTNNASFDTGAKIILAATQSLAYLASSPQNITILQAANLTGTGINKPEDLLFTRVYDASYKTTTTINASSILFSVENITASNNTISAKLTLNNISALGLQVTTLQTKLIDSLLKNKIVPASETVFHAFQQLKPNLLGSCQSVIDTIEGAVLTTNKQANKLTTNNIIISPTSVKNNQLVAYNNNNNILTIGTTNLTTISPKDATATVVIGTDIKSASNFTNNSVRVTLSKIEIDQLTIQGKTTNLVEDALVITGANTLEVTDNNGLHIGSKVNLQTGAGKHGLHIAAPFKGNITNDGVIGDNDTDVGLMITQPIDGTFTNKNIINGDNYAIYATNMAASQPKLTFINDTTGVINDVIQLQGIKQLINKGDIKIRKSTSIKSDFINFGTIYISQETLYFLESSDHHKYNIINKGSIHSIGFVNECSLTNQKNGHIKASWYLTIKGSVINHGTLESVSCSGQTDYFGFHQEVTNTGTIKAPYGFNFYKKITNTGIITFGDTHNHYDFKNTLINQGTIEASGAIAILQNLTNSGSISQSDLTKDFAIGDSSNKSYSVTNTGYIKAGNLTNYNTINNQADMLVNNLTLKADLTNSGTLTAKSINIASGANLTVTTSGKFCLNGGDLNGDLKLKATVGIATNDGVLYINKSSRQQTGTLEVGNLLADNEATFSISANAKTIIHKPANATNVNIVNAGTLELLTASTLTTYTSNDGHLTINIGDELQTKNNLLFITKSNFTRDSKILINAKFTNIKSLIIPNLEILHGEWLVCDGKHISPNDPSHLNLFHNMITIKTIGKGIFALSNYNIKAGSIIITADLYYKNKQFLANMQNSKQQLFTKNKTIVDAISFNINKNNIAISPPELVLGQQLIKVKNKSLTIASNLPVAIPKVIIGTSVYQQNNLSPISQATVKLSKIIIANITIAANRDAVMINGNNKLILTDSKGLVIANNTKITANETALNIIPSFKGNITNHGIIGNKQTTTALQLTTVNGIIINYATIEANTNAIKLTSKQSKLKIINHGQLIGDVIADKTTMVTIKNYNNIIASKITNIKHLTNSGKITIAANNKLQNYLGLKHAELIINIDNCFYNNNWQLPESLLYINKANFAAESYLTINANKYANKLSESPQQLTLLIAASLTIAGKNADQLINDNKNLLALTSKSILIKINNPILILTNNNYQLTAAISRAKTTSNNPLAKQLQITTNNLIKNTHKQQPVTRLKEQCLENNNQASCAISHRLALARAKQAVFIYGNQQQTTGINAGDVAGTNYQLWSSFNYQHKNYHQQADIKSGRGNSRSYNFGIDSTNNKLGCGLMYSYSKTTANINFTNTQPIKQQADYQALALYNDYKFSPFNLQTAILASKTKYHVNKNKYDDYTYSVLIELVYQYHLTQLQLIEFAVASKFIQNITNKYLASAIETKVFSNYAIADNINLNYGLCFSYCHYTKLTHQTTNYFNDNNQLNNQFNIKAVVNLIIKQAFSCGITTDYSYSNISQTLAASLLLKYKFMLV